MMHPALKTMMASALALATVVPAAAQNYPNGSPYRPSDNSVAQQRDYDAQRDQYDAQRDAYRDQRADYRAARADYERRMADWEARRADYDARYGSGAYTRAYGAAPAWDDRRWASAPPAAGYYGRDAVAPTSGSGYYGRDGGPGPGQQASCNNNSAVTAGIIGALAGSVLGSNVAARGRRGEGAVLGGVVGAVGGAAVGHANDKYKCDQRGAYWTYNDTVPYRVSNDVYRDDRYAENNRRGCRLAPAPVNGSDYRYVRVCPDSDGRFRVTG
jgi:hypothetical protein